MLSRYLPGGKTPPQNLAVIFFTCCKGWKAFKVVARLFKKKIRRSDLAVIFQQQTFVICII